MGSGDSCFSDTGVIFGASMCREINYSVTAGHNPFEDSANRCFEYLDSKKKKHFCPNVKKELINLKERRNILFDMVVLKLNNDDSSDGFKRLKSDLKSKGSFSKDWKWFKSKIEGLSYPDPIGITNMIDDIQIKLNSNIEFYIRSFEEFDSSNSANLIDRFNKILHFLNNRENKPNHEDLMIYSNAILVNNDKEIVEFATIDGGFRSLRSFSFKRAFSNEFDKLSIPEINIIS